MCILHSPLGSYDTFNSEGNWLSGKTLDCRPRDCEFDPPSLQLKLLKGVYMYWFFPGKMLPCISALHWAR